MSEDKSCLKHICLFVRIVFTFRNNSRQARIMLPSCRRMSGPSSAKFGFQILIRILGHYDLIKGFSILQFPFAIEVLSF